MPSGTLIIYKSIDGCQTWEMILPAAVPEWVKAPDVIGRIVDGEACQLDIDGDWYIAKRVLNGFDHGAILASMAKRIRRAERNIRGMIW